MDADTEWHAVAELDTADLPPAVGGIRAEYEFDATVHRRKRSAVLEKADADRKAKRQKQEKLRSEEESRARRKAAEADGSRKEEKEKEKPKANPTPTPASAEPVAEVSIVPVQSKAASKAAPNPAEALQGFLDDHPEFMRVLQNPKKCLSDPRVKSMFIRELENYPVVKSFLASKGLTFK